MTEESTTTNIAIKAPIALLLIIGFAAILITFFLFPGLSSVLFYTVESSCKTIALALNSARSMTGMSSQGISTIEYPEDAFMVQVYVNSSCYHFFLEKFEEFDPNIRDCENEMCICTGRYNNFLCSGEYTNNPNLCYGCGVWPFCIACPGDRNSCSPKPSSSNACHDWETCLGNWNDGKPSWIDPLFIQQGKLRNASEKLFWYKVFGNSKDYLEDFCYHFFFGMSGATTNVTSMDCRPINGAVPLVVHDEDCNVDDCGQNVFLWLQDIEGSKINYAEARGFENFITITEYDVR